MAMNLLRELCETPGVSGREERLRAIVRRELTPLVGHLSWMWPLLVPNERP